MKARAALVSVAALAVAHKAEANTHWAHEHPWHHRWNHLQSGERSWVRSTARCESGNNAHTNTGNGFYGLLQFDLRTAWAAGFKKRPDLTTWHQQAVRGARWRRHMGSSPWPVCGR